MEDTIKNLDREVMPPEKILKGKDLENFKFVRKRIDDLKESRKDVFGIDIEKKWTEADRDYIPHELSGKKGTQAILQEELGWAGRMGEIKSDKDWQSGQSEPNVFIKVQIALSILVDRNPEAIFYPSSEKFEQTSYVMKHLYKRNWALANSKEQLKLFMFNIFKYGWAVARTYPKISIVGAKHLKDVDENGKKSWEERDVVEYNDVYRENLDPWNTWVDDMARPGAPESTRDWAFLKIYDYETAKNEFGDYPNFKYVKPRQIDKDQNEQKSSSKSRKSYKEKDLVEVYFYENRVRDLFVVMANNIPIVVEPLPIEDINGNKKLSLWQAPCFLRHAESVYGIGLPEAMKQNQTLYDQLSNMTMDQLKLSIYKTFFYSGTDQLDGSGEIEIKPGVGNQVSDPKNITWLDIKGPGEEAWKGLDLVNNRIDKSSMINPPLSGEITGKTAFEIAQAKENALRNLKIPLAHVCDALKVDAYITVAIMRQIYSIPEVTRVTDPDIIQKYLQETSLDPELYEANEDGTINVKTYPEVRLGLEQDNKGLLMESEDAKFFRLKPSGLNWDGIIEVRPQSILAPSVELEKAQTLELMNILVPLLAQPPEIALKPCKQALKKYDADPNDWLPDEWLQPPAPPVETGNLPLTDTTNMVPPTQEEMMMQQAQGQQSGPQPAASNLLQQKIPNAQTIVPSTKIRPERSGVRGMVGKIVDTFTRPRKR